jgi:hypothetical protein
MSNQNAREAVLIVTTVSHPTIERLGYKTVERHVVAETTVPIDYEAAVQLPPHTYVTHSEFSEELRIIKRSYDFSSRKLTLSAEIRV